MGNLREEEAVDRAEETELQLEIDTETAPNPFQWLWKRAELLNLKAIVSDEEAIVRDEERDAQSDLKKFDQDAVKLEGLEKIEGRLRFEGGENKMLDELERLLPK